jgi:hypothetical protein
VNRLTRATLILLFWTACSQTVTVPPAGQDTAPNMTWNAFVVQQPSGYSGDVQPGKENVGMTTSVNITEGARVQFSGSAKNPGDVQQFHVTIQQAGNPLYDVTTTSTPDASGQVPDVLSIVGTNGAGGSGNQPIVVTLSTPVIVTATATNFHAMSQTMTVTYNPAPSNILVGGGGHVRSTSAPYECTVIPERHPRSWPLSDPAAPTAFLSGHSDLDGHAGHAHRQYRHHHAVHLDRHRRSHANGASGCLRPVYCRMLEDTAVIELLLARLERKVER